jgi:flagellar basal-body rod protein FlgG
MNGVLFIGATGLRAQQAAVDVLANNIANINTPAFKRGGVAFSELVSQGGGTNGIGAPAAGAESGLGVAALASARSFSQGDVRKTDNSMDIAIRGNGFIELMAPGGQTLLWRGSSLKVNPDGFLAANNGMALKASISVPNDASRLEISPSGVVTAWIAGDSRAQTVGQIDLVGVADTRALIAVGEGTYRIDDPLADTVRGTPGESNLGLIAQGFAEGSNVSLTDEMVAMMLMQRAYAANARVIQLGDEMMGLVNQLRR